MNWRVLIGLIVGVSVVIGSAFAGWWYLFNGNSGTAQETPTPVPTVGGLPVGSGAPAVSGLPVSFRGVCPDTWTGQKDTDGDGVPDSVEAIYGTDANNPDTDGDGYNDGAEIRTGHNPLNPNSSAILDSDHDGLQDNVECTAWHTDPFNPDSDGDGFTDGAEVKNGFDPAKKGDGHGSDRLPTPVPVIRATPVATYSPNNNATPTPVNSNPTQAPIPTQPINNGGSSGSLTLIPLSQLNITNKTSAGDMKAYLAQIDSLRPQELSDGTTIVQAIQSAASGNTAPLASARQRVLQFATALKGVAVPQSAGQYHQLYASLITFLGQTLQTIEQNAVSKPDVAANALLTMQNILPTYITQMTQLRQPLETIANGK